MVDNQKILEISAPLLYSVPGLLAGGVGLLVGGVGLLVGGE